MKFWQEDDVKKDNAGSQRHPAGRTNKPPSEPDVLYCSRYFVIIDKPPGLSSHPGRGAAHSVEAFFAKLSKRKEGPWLVHRLDRDTSGCLLIALRKQALVAAQAAFSQQKVTKIYWAVLRGSPAVESGIIDLPLLRVEKNRHWKMEVDPKGQESRTSWRILQRGPDATLVELRLESGRTHQARVHCAAIGHPIMGDPIYGSASKIAPHHLHCRSLTLTCNGEVIHATAPPNQAISSWITANKVGNL